MGISLGEPFFFFAPGHQGGPGTFFSAIYPCTGYPFPCILFAVDLDVAVLLCLMPFLCSLTLAGWFEILFLDCENI